MSVNFVDASAQYLNCSAPLNTVRPMTIGCWYNMPADASSHGLAILYETSGWAGWEFYADNDDVTTRLGQWTGSATQGTATVTSTRGEWNFAVARLIAAANKRVANLYPGGTSHAQSTSTSNPAASTNIAIGSVLDTGGLGPKANGRIAEWWMTNTDIQPDGGQLSDALLMQLAYRGPFSVPHVAQAVVEYRSFRKGAGTGSDVPGEVYQRGNQRTWTEVNGPIALGDHPPLYSNYVRPNQTRRLLVV